jgi:O-antigen/teichoic acid export membrane protein
VIARALGPDLAGQVNYLTWLTATVGLVTGMGVPQTLMRYRAEFRALADVYAQEGLFIWACKWFGITTFFGALVVVAILAKHPGLSSYVGLIPLAMLLFWAQRQATLGKSCLVGGQRFRKLAILSFLSTLLELVILIWLVAGQGGLNVALWAYIASYTVLALPAFAIFRNIRHHSTLVIPDDLSRRLWLYGISVWGGAVLSSLVMQRSEVFFLERYLGMREVAFYSAGFTLVSIVSQGTTMLVGALLPHFAVQYSHEDQSGIVLVFGLSTKLIAFLIVPICFIMAALADPMTNILFGSAFSSAGVVVTALSIAAAFNAVSSAASGLVYGIERQWIIPATGVLALMALIVIGVVLIPVWGLSAVAWGKAGVQIGGVLIGLFYVRFRANIKVPVKALYKTFLASLAAATVAFWVNSMIDDVLGLVYSWGVGLLAYFILSHSLLTWDEREKAVLRKAVQKLAARSALIQSLILFGLGLG